MKCRVYDLNPTHAIAESTDALLVASSDMFSQLNFLMPHQSESCADHTVVGATCQGSQCHGWQQEVHFNEHEADGELFGEDGRKLGFFHCAWQHVELPCDLPKADRISTTARPGHAALPRLVDPPQIGNRS